MLVTALVCVVSAGCDRGNHPGQIGQRAPEFVLNDGQTSVDLAKLRGHVVVLNFWATWCAPCVQELPSLELMQRELPQVQVLAVSTDTDAATYSRFLTRYHVTLMSVRDDENRSNALYGTFRYPETYVIDKAGIVRRKFIGPQDWTSPEIVDYLSKLEAQPVPAA
jgi:cytochrome c biogenesis protein CcmG/thiol:disulfide interchange protein DsbE